jgi:hypothetical protein
MTGYIIAGAESAVLFAVQEAKDRERLALGSEKVAAERQASASEQAARAIAARVPQVHGGDSMRAMLRRQRQMRKGQLRVHNGPAKIRHANLQES